MDNLIDRQAAIDAVTEALRGLPVVCKDIAEEAIKQLPPAQPVIVPCDYAKACNEVSMNRIASAVVYMEILEDFKKYGYVLVDMSENMPPANNSEIPNSSDTISRQAAIDALKQQAETMSEWSNRYAEQRKGVLTAVNIVEDLPPAQPEIVRCKDCKYWNSGSCEYPEHAVNCQDYWVGDIETEAEHFCGYADKKEVTTWAKSN